jgi:hypothetical protein
MMNNKDRKLRLRWHALALALSAYSALAFSQMPGPVPPELVAAAKLNPRIVAGDSWIVDKTMVLQSLRIEPGAAVSAPAGHSLTMTVDGVETTLKPGKYRGQVVLTVTEQVPVKFTELLTHRFRQALYLDGSGIVPSKSVLAAAGPVVLKNGVLSGANIRSVGENFNGIVVAGGHYTLKDVVLNFEGNGGNDFAGYGAGIMSDGKGTTLVLDGAKVSTHGAVRTSVIGNGGSNLIVKNSEISSKGGVLPTDYVSNVTPGEMKDAPWMLGISGNVRATNVLGDDTTCTYINSKLSADAWGVLSVDASQNIHLTAINSQIDLKGKSGYGAYAIGNATNSFYGSVMNVPTHGVIITDGHAVFGSSSKENVAALNSRLKLGLSEQELAALQPAQTVVNSQRYGVMMWGDATVKIADGTIFNTGEAVFLNKGTTSVIEVDGSKGAQLNTRNGVIFQAIDNDDPGPVMVDGLMANTGVFREPATPPAKLKDFDLSAVHKTDMVARFTKIRLKGDFYNAIRSRSIGGGMGPNGPSTTPPVISGSNLVLDFQGTELTGVISATSAKHLKSVITAADYEYLGRVRNTPAPAINNGVIVKLSDNSRWTVTGTSYLTSLVIDDKSSIVGKGNRAVKLTVDGVVTPLKPGSYKGAITLSAAG